MSGIEKIQLPLFLFQQFVIICFQAVPDATTLKTDKESTSKARVIGASIEAVLLHLLLQAEVLPQAFAPFLLFGLRAFALYVEAYYFYLQKNYEKSIGIIESALTMGAEKYLLKAGELTRLDDLIEEFGEHHGLLGGTLEAVIEKCIYFVVNTSQNASLAV